MKILHLEYEKYPQESIDILESKHDIIAFDCNSQEELYSHLESNFYDVIFTRLGLNLDKRCIELQLGKIKYIVSPTTGLNHIDVDFATEKSISVVSLSGEFEFLNQIRSTAEHTWGLLLMLIRHLREATQITLLNGWSRSNFMSDELSSKTLGIIGYGRLGQIISRYGVAFNMEVKVFDKDISKINDLPTGVEFYNLDDILKSSDYIILLINFTKDNIRFIGKNEFMKMKEGAYFINTARGELIDEDALISSLYSGKIKGAALDVLAGDSTWGSTVQGQNHLIDYAKSNNNLLITPHMGGYGINSITQTRKFIVQKFLNIN
jgi:D-3-phosphoglycerate dehydrogenase